MFLKSEVMFIIIIIIVVVYDEYEIWKWSEMKA